MEDSVELLANIVVVVLGILALTAAIRYGFRERAIMALRGLPGEKREKLIASYSRLIAVHEVSLWFFPLFAIVLVVAGRVLQERTLTLLGIINVLIAVVIVEDYMFRKAIVDHLRRASG